MELLVLYGSSRWAKDDKVQENLGLKEKKLTASWHVLSEYVKMTGPCVLFVLDEMRKKSMKEGKITTGEGLEWGVLFGFEQHTQRIRKKLIK